MIVRTPLAITLLLLISLFSESGWGAPVISEEVRQAVASNGQTRVLIELALPVQRERALSKAQVLAQREAIARQQGQLRRSLKAVGSPADKSFRTVPGMALTVNEQVLNALERSPLVKRVYPDRISAPILDDSTQVIQADQMWANTPVYDGTGYAVAVLDTGVDKNHPFFNTGDFSPAPPELNAIVAEFCSSTDSDDGTVTSTSFCPGDGSATSAVDSGLDCDLSVSGCGHGTHVAGIVAGRQTTSSYGNLAGVAPGASIIAMQVFSRFDNVPDCNGPCALSFSSDQVAALDHLLTLDESQGGPLKVAAANMSLGGEEYSAHCDGDNPLFEAALTNLRDNDIAVVIATGNAYYDSAVSAPACHADAIAVGSTTKSDRISNFSNIADGLVDLYAPGSSIASSVLGDSYEPYSGTSMAAPHVAGAWALMRQALDNAGSTDVSVIEELLESTGTPINLRDNGSDAGFSVPRINIFDAAFPPATHTVTASATAGGSIDPAGAVAVVEDNTVTFTVSPQAGYEIGVVDTDCPNPQPLGDQYTVGPIVGDCFVQANFVEVAMSLSETGEGEVLLFPFYTAEAGAQTEFYVANSTDHVKAVRISVREGLRGAETLSWPVYLGPQDSFRAFIAADQEGDGAAVYAHSVWTNDTTCTVPSFPADPVPLRNFEYLGDSLDSAERTLAGYIEVVEMGQWDPAVGKGLAAANQQCAELEAAWASGGAWVLDPAAEALPWQGGGLSGNAAVQQWREDLLEMETLLAYDAIAISGFARNQLPAEYHAYPGSDGNGDYPTPSLRAAALTFEQSINGVIREQTADTGLEAISALLTAAQIEVEPPEGIAEGAPESWLITMPTKYHHSSEQADLGPFSQVWDPATSTACEHIELGQQNGDLPLLNTWDSTACAAVNVLERAAAGSEPIPAPNWLTGPLTSIDGETADAARLTRSGPNVGVDDRLIAVTTPDNNVIEKIGLPVIAIPIYRDLANDASVVGDFEEKKEHFAVGLELVLGNLDWTTATVTVPFTTLNTTGFDVDLYTLSCQAEGSAAPVVVNGEGPERSSISANLNPRKVHQCSLIARTAIGESEPVLFTLAYTGVSHRATNNTSGQGGSVFPISAFSEFIGDEDDIADQETLYALVYLDEGMLVERVDGSCVVQLVGDVIGDGSLFYQFEPITSDCSFEFVFARDPSVQLAPTLNSLSTGDGSLTAAFTPNSGGAEADTYTLTCSPTSSLRQASPEVHGFNPLFESQSRQRLVTPELMSPAEIEAGGHRCGLESMQEPASTLDRTAMPQSTADCTYTSTTISGQYNPLADGFYTIPVVWHVIYASNGEGYVSQSDIEAQMAVLNEDFGAQFETSLRFTLHSVNYEQNDAWFGADEDQWKPNLVQDPDRYMNVYTNDINALGYAYLPDGAAGEWYDGVVMSYPYVGGRNVPNVAPYDLGRTLVHEVGHYLGLHHTFNGDGGQCANTYQSGDYIVDTWPHNTPDGGVVGANVCGGVSPIENFMNYSQDIAMIEFTAEQSNRMICSLQNFRPALATTGYTATGTSSPLTVTGLTNGTSYTCSVTSAGAAGTSAPSSSLSATPAAPTRPLTPSIIRTESGDGELFISVGGSNGGSPILQWQASCTDGVNTFTGDSFTGPNVTVSGLANGTTYQCRVRVRNALGWSANWSPYTGSLVPEEQVMGLPIWLLYQATVGSGGGNGAESTATSSE